uniref:Hppd1 n=1 Tax=Arundo donax TaxID=35708 RepID=A0A0A9DF89_ARUDO
MWSNRRRP